jgi:hypothetical protein
MRRCNICWEKLPARNPYDGKCKVCHDLVKELGKRIGMGIEREILGGIKWGKTNALQELTPEDAQPLT